MIFKLRKGEYGYIERYRRFSFVIAAMMYALSIAMFAVGLISTGSRYNYFSIIAAVGILPAAKFTVYYIMSLRFKALGRAEYDELQKNGAYMLFDLLYTSLKYNININAVSFFEDGIYIYTVDGSTDRQRAAAIVQNDLRLKGSFDDMNVFVLTDITEYMNMISDKDVSYEPDRELAELIKAMSL